MTIERRFKNTNQKYLKFSNIFGRHKGTEAQRHKELDGKSQKRLLRFAKEESNR